MHCMRQEKSYYYRKMMYLHLVLADTLSALQASASVKFRLQQTHTPGWMDGWIGQRKGSDTFHMFLLQTLTAGQTELRLVLLASEKPQ